VPTYRINSPTIAMVLENGRHVARTVRTGAIITIKNGKPFNGETLIEVICNRDGRTVMMFSQDLRAHSTKMDGE
jgi:hypothetical protein